MLNEFEHPLSQLYTDWLSRDTDEMDAFRDSIACCADDILRKESKKNIEIPRPYILIPVLRPWFAERFLVDSQPDRTLTCAGTFEKDATNAYNDGKLPAFF